MKRYVVGTLLFSIVMFVQLFGNIPVFADTFVPTSSYDFIGLSDLGYALVGGAEFDFDGSPYIIDNYNSLTAEQKEIEKSLAAREFLSDYLKARGIAFEENGTLQRGPAYYTIAFGLAGQEFFEAFQTATAAEQEDLEYNMPISPSRFADWAGYNKYWFNRYANDFASVSSTIETYPDLVNYPYIEFLNDFISKDYASNLWVDFYSVDKFLAGRLDRELFLRNPLKSYSYIISDADNLHQASANTPVQFSFSASSTFITINIVTNQDSTVSVFYNYITPVSFSEFFTNNSWVNNNYTFMMNYLSTLDNVTYDAYMSSSQTYTAYSYTSASFESLSLALQYIYKHYSNINLYVDGIPWELVSDPAPVNPTIPDFPDIINQNTGELAYDIAMPKTQDYSGSFDLTSLFDAIREGIAGASDGDLATGSTIGSLDVGRTYTGEGIDIQDRVIDLTSSRIFDGTLTDDTTGRLPKPPVIPGAVQSGLSGISILAKYIDATQCILPEEVITAFWGCVWILIMLGLIKNLHR